MSYDVTLANRILENAHKYTDTSGKDDYTVHRLTAKANQLYDTVKTFASVIPNDLILKCKLIKRRRKLANMPRVSVLQPIPESAAGTSNETAIDISVAPVTAPATTTTLDTTTANDDDIVMQDAPTNKEQPTTAAITIVPTQEEVAPQQEEEVADEPVIIDESRLQAWFDYIVKKTNNYSIDELDKLFSAIYKHIYLFRSIFDRNALLDQLEKL